MRGGGGGGRAARPVCRAGQEGARRRCPSVRGSPSLASSLGVECKSQPKSPFVLSCPLLLLRGEPQGNRRPVLGSGRGVRAAACQAFSKRPPVGPDVLFGPAGLATARSRRLPGSRDSPGPRRCQLWARASSLRSRAGPCVPLPPLLSRWVTGMHCLSPWRAPGASDVG